MPDDRIRISALPPATTPSDADVLAGVQSGTTKKFSLSTIKNWLQNLFVPLTRTVNNKALSADITLDASDIGAQPTITASGILKGDGAGGVSAAVAGTDYATPDQLDDKASQSELAAVETGTTASRAYLPGERFVWQGTLYRAKTAIASGAAFTPNTNCESTTVAAELGIPVEYVVPTTAKFTSLTGAAYRVGNVVVFSFRGVASEAMATNTELLRFSNASPGTNGQRVIITRANTVGVGRINGGTISSVPTGRLYSNVAITAEDEISIFGMYFV